MKIVSEIIPFHIPNQRPFELGYDLMYKLGKKLVYALGNNHGMNWGVGVRKKKKETVYIELSFIHTSMERCKVIHLPRVSIT